MLRLLKLSFVGVIFFMLSCEECTRCSCTYKETTLNQTLNGEEEIVTIKTTYVWDDEDSAFVVEECIKGDDSFTIKSRYVLEEESSLLDSMVCTCIDF